MSQRRRAIHAYVSEEAHDRWHDFAAENGVSVSALLEALAEEVAGADEKTEAHAVVLERAISSSRQIDASRRRRRKD